MTRYAILENISTGKVVDFVLQEEFLTWANQVEQKRAWDIVGGFIYDIFGDRTLVEHMSYWS